MPFSQSSEEEKDIKEVEKNTFSGVDDDAIFYEFLRSLMSLHFGPVPVLRRFPPRLMAKEHLSSIDKAWLAKNYDVPRPAKIVLFISG